MTVKQERDGIALGDIAALRVGYQLRRAVEPDDEGENALIQLANVRDGVIDLSNLPCMTLPDVKTHHILKSGDILLRSRGATYEAALLAEPPKNAVALAPLFVLRLMRHWIDFSSYSFDDALSDPFSESEPLLSEYLVWFINRPATQAALRTQQTGVIPSVSVQTFADLKIIVPFVEVQQRIVQADAAMREERRLTLELLNRREQKTRALLEKALQRPEPEIEW